MIKLAKDFFEAIEPEHLVSALDWRKAYSMLRKSGNDLHRNDLNKIRKEIVRDRLDLN